MQAAATTVVARDPWRAATPKALRRMRTRIAAGDRGSERMLSDLRRYNREHPDDARGHLLLARLFLNRGWFDEVTTQYQRAFARDPSSRGDPHMLRNLLRAAANEGSSARASELVQAVYGREALAAIAEARTRAPPEERARLDRLASALAP
jgi:cytochrome c-type biogenesis protein CcmH/NrfG